MSADVGSITWYNEDSLSPLTVLRPTGPDGDLLLAIMVQHAPSGHLGDMSGPTTGWDTEGTFDGASTDGAVFTHTMAGADPSSWSFPYYPNADVCLALFRITSPAPFPIQVVTSSITTSITSSYDSPSLTPTDIDDLLICAVADICSGTTFAVTAPSGMTSQGQTQASATFMALAAASEQLTSNAATGVRTWTSLSPTGQDGGSFSISIQSGVPENPWSHKQTPPEKNRAWSPRR